MTARRTPSARALAAACLVGAAGLAASAFVDLPAAEATQDYAKKESKDCSHCHLNPKGAGPRNAAGREFEANGHRFGVKSWTSDAVRDKYLRACAALSSRWYAEAARLLAEVKKDETLPGGLALADGTLERFKMFPRSWLGAAKKLLAKGDRGVANAFEFLARLESQFPETDEGKEATKLLDAAVKDSAAKDSAVAKDNARKAAAEEARAVEQVRLVLLRGRTEWDLGNAAEARKLFDAVLADPRGKAFEKDIREVLEPSPAK
jgi:hypothetical protein